MTKPIKIFVTYSHKDAEYLADDSLLGFLKGLEKEGVIFWDDRQIQLGELWDEIIKSELADAQIALVLVSQAFLDSGYCQKIEIQQLLERKAHLFPVILSACDWKRHEWLSKRQFIPAGDQTLEEHYVEPGVRKRLFLTIRKAILEHINNIQHLNEKPVTVSAIPPQTKNIINAAIQIKQQDYPPIDWRNLAGLIDKINQTEKIRAHLNADANRTAFIVYGDFNDWPEAVAMRLAFELCPDPERDISQPKTLYWSTQIAQYSKDGGTLLRRLLDQVLLDRKKELVPDIDALVNILNSQTQPFVFALHANANVYPIPPKLQNELIEYWEHAIAPRLSVKHVFLIIIETVIDDRVEKNEPKPWYKNIFRKNRTECTKDNGNILFQTVLGKSIQADRLITDFEKLSQSHIMHWKKECSEYIPPPYLMHFENKEDELFNEGESIAHYKLQKKIVNLLKSFN